MRVIGSFRRSIHCDRRSGRRLYGLLQAARTKPCACSERDWLSARPDFIKRVQSGDGHRLMGFGHRVCCRMIRGRR
jgi:hypothetical protein